MFAVAHWLSSKADVLDARFKSLKDFDLLTGWTGTNKMTFNRDKDNPVFKCKNKNKKSISSVQDGEDPSTVHLQRLISL